MDVPGRQVLQDASTRVFVLDAHGMMGSDWHARMAPATDLNAGFSSALSTYSSAQSG
jgi:hypothetical protein